MKILYHWPNPETVYAGRTISHGYKHAFQDLGHEFRFFSNSESIAEVCDTFSPDIFLTSLNSYYLKSIDLNILKKLKNRGLKVFVNTPFWNSPLSGRVGESGSLSSNLEYVRLIQSGEFGDIYFNICEPDDARMNGFKKNTGYAPKTLLLAADKLSIYPELSREYVSDIAYIGTNLPQKRDFFRDVIFPLGEKYSLKIYGQDWSLQDKLINLIQKGSQYFDIPVLRSLRKPSLELDDERKVYTSSAISINVHEVYQREFGDLNERTFKIPLAGGFEIVDNVPTLHKYFTPGKDIIIAESRDDWWEKIEYYINNPEKRLAITEAGRKRIEKEHTYHNRVETIMKWYEECNNGKQ